MAGTAAAVAGSILDAQLRAVAYTGPATLYLSLHTADPGLTGASELAGTTRQAIAFTAAGGTASTSNSGVINFTGMPAATVTHVSLWSAVTAGTFQQSGALTASKTTASGDTLQFAAASITASQT